MAVNLWKRNGVWYARGRVVLPDGTTVPVNRSTRIEVGPGTRRYAEQAAQRLVEEIRSGRSKARIGWVDGIDPEAASVRDAVDAYLRRRDVSGDFINVLESFARALGGLRLMGLDEREVMVWAGSGPRLRASGRAAAPRTIQVRLKAVKAVLRLAEVKMRWPVPDLDLKAGGLVLKQEKWLTAEDRDRLLAALDPFWRPFATTLFMTGARPVELGRLTWADVRPPAKHQAYGRVILRHLKGRTNGGMQWRERDVPLVPAVMSALGDRGRSGDFVFRDADGDAISRIEGPAGRMELRRKARAQIGEAFQLAAEAAGLGHLGITPYWARHTFASLLVQESVPLPVVAELLGHMSIREVERTYGHLAPHQKEAAVTALGGLAQASTK
jgi:integrase